MKMVIKLIVSFVKSIGAAFGYADEENIDKFKETVSLIKDSDFIVIKDETAGMLTVEEIAELPNGQEMLNELKKFFNYYSKDEIEDIADLISDHYHLSDVIRFLGEQNAIHPKLKDKLFEQVKKNNSYYERSGFIEYCKPTTEEIDTIAELSDSITDIEHLMNTLIENKYKLTLKVEEVAYRKLMELDKQLDERQNMNRIYDSVSNYAYQFMSKLKHLSNEKMEQIFQLIIKDTQYARYILCEHKNFNDGIDNARRILKLPLHECALSNKQRDELFYKLTNESEYTAQLMYEDAAIYHLTKDKIDYLYSKMIESGKGIDDILRKEGLRFSQLKQIIKALPNFKDERERNACIDIISKNYRGTVAKDQEIKDIFDSLLVMKKLTESSKKAE